MCTLNVRVMPQRKRKTSHKFAFINQRWQENYENDEIKWEAKRMHSTAHIIYSALFTLVFSCLLFLISHSWFFFFYLYRFFFFVRVYMIFSFYINIHVHTMILLLSIRVCVCIYVVESDNQVYSIKITNHVVFIKFHCTLCGDSELVCMCAGWRARLAWLA